MSQLLEDSIRQPAECCPCDECGRDLVVGDMVAVDLDGGWVYCSTDCAEADATSDSESERKGGAS